MSDREKTMVEKIADLPPELQARFCDKIDGAIMALDMSEKKEACGDAENKV